MVGIGVAGRDRRWVRSWKNLRAYGARIERRIDEGSITLAKGRTLVAGHEVARRVETFEAT